MLWNLLKIAFRLHPLSCEVDWSNLWNNVCGNSELSSFRCTIGRYLKAMIQKEKFSDLIFDLQTLHYVFSHFSLESEPNLKYCYRYFKMTFEFIGFSFLICGINNYKLVAYDSCENTVLKIRVHVGIFGFNFFEIELYLKLVLYMWSWHCLYWNKTQKYYSLKNSLFSNKHFAYKHLANSFQYITFGASSFS